MASPDKTPQRHCTETPVPFPDGVLGSVQLPYPLTQAEADRVKAIIAALVMIPRGESP